MKINSLLLGLTLATISHNTLAYTPFPLSPHWVKSIYQSLSENTENVWRGEVVGYNGGLSLIIRSLDGYNTEVTLLHLANKKGSTQQDIALGAAYLQSLVGKQVYVLSPQKKQSVAAKLIDADGADLNLTFVSGGIFDINTTSLFNKSEKAKYLNAVKFAQISRKGIWH